ncbi:MAG: VWA domain-containing protein [Isosphaeraceae bacterium]|nr:VWA domain-containing protein [Isosphaeraceae bacterium]
MSRRRTAALLSSLLVLGLSLPGAAEEKPAASSTVKAPAAPKNAKPKDAEPRVIPTEQERSSRFLRPPGTDRYDPSGIDWESVPPWRQTSFFGVRAQGQVFIYVVDCSGSMIEESRLTRAKIELRRSVNALQAPQRFQVIFYNDEPIAMPGFLPKSADLASKDQLLQWLRLIEPDGKTDPRGALGLALSLRPDAIFLLSDGEFPDGTASSVTKKNPRKVPIHCIDLGDGDTADQLKQIARESGGQYKWRPDPSAP